MKPPEQPSRQNVGYLNHEIFERLARVCRIPSKLDVGATLIESGRDPQGPCDCICKPLLRVTLDDLARSISVPLLLRESRTSLYDSAAQAIRSKLQCLRFPGNGEGFRGYSSRLHFDDVDQLFLHISKVSAACFFNSRQSVWKQQAFIRGTCRSDGDSCIFRQDQE